MRKVRSCGVIVFRRGPAGAGPDAAEFLLMRHRRRYDLPKGHMLPGETERACALRELREETGISPELLVVDPGFRWEHTYYPRYGRLGGAVVEKRLVVFLGRLSQPFDVRVSEHIGFAWLPWAPPHRLQELTVDPLLAELEHHFGDRGPHP